VVRMVHTATDYSVLFLWWTEQQHSLWWWSSVVVAQWSRSTKLTYVWPG